MSEHEKSETRGRVVVGVDGSPASVRAAQYALAEAARTGSGVHVLHAVQTYVAMGATGYTLPLEDMTAAGRTILRTVVDEVGPAAESTDLTTELVHGGAVPELAAASHDARLVVVGSDRRSVLARLFTGNVSTGVAAASAAPVVAVPETWPSQESTGRVLVGLKRPERSGELLAEAFAVARTRRASLVVLHAWHLPTGYEDLLVDSDTREAWEGRSREEMEAALAPWRAAHPEVEVEVRVVHDQAAHALVSASVSADELVVIRRARGVPAALHLGPTARAVLAHAHCPVRVVPALHQPVTPDLVLEDAGSLQR